MLGKDKVAILHSSLSWSSPTGNLISRAMTKDTRQARSDELIKLYREDNIYNFHVEGFRNWQAQISTPALPRACFPALSCEADCSVASSLGSCGEQNTDVDVVSEQESSGSRG